MDKRQLATLLGVGACALAMVPGATGATQRPALSAAEPELPAAAAELPFGGVGDPPASVTETQQPETQAAPYVVASPESSTTTVRQAVAGAPSKRTANILLAAYRKAASSVPDSCGLPVSLLAAIGEVESGNLAGRRVDRGHRAVPPVLGPVLDGNGFAAIADTDDGALDGDRTWDRAVGPMQFIPSTWARFGVDLDGDGEKNPQDVEDAAGSAAAYLCHGGRDLSTDAGLREAVLSYNHSAAYLNLVTTLNARFAAGGLSALSSPGLALGTQPVALSPSGGTTGTGSTGGLGWDGTGGWGGGRGGETLEARGHIALETEVTLEPEDDATEPPLDLPSDVPTDPSGEPGDPPVDEPTDEPTGQPTGDPTTSPTKEPAGEPTAQPSPTDAPSPTAEPTDEPSEEPTADPSAPADPAELDVCPGFDPDDPAAAPTEGTATDGTAPAAEPTGTPGDPTSAPADPAEVPADAEPCLSVDTDGDGVADAVADPTDQPAGSGDQPVAPQQAPAGRDERP